ncbi:LysE/ArgO family amino acid transporter [Thalassotalea sp. LPB0316]|uniref:LysE/ArgO family amino acid transporter n=1 Tax=Thalassotalea sp. LPB0316 TaxID=2769490 RepID=UPI001D043CB6|nr:LysE/ArgO family amino acid transporter [Thalassotalea sp. LPB0316]
MFLTLAKGFVIGAGLIMPIGAQNAYVLSQGIKRNYHILAATICIICDFILMSLGVFGGGALLSSHPVIALVVTILGIVFLTVYGALFFKSFYLASNEQMAEQMSPVTKKTVIFTTLAVTLLNPHVYLDTVVLIGSISNQFDEAERVFFLFGTLLASLTWFYMLSLGAAKMSPWLSTPKVQRGINLLVALIMWAIAASLLTTLL